MTGCPVCGDREAERPFCPRCSDEPMGAAAGPPPRWSAARAPLRRDVLPPPTGPALAPDPEPGSTYGPGPGPGYSYGSGYGGSPPPARPPRRSLPRRLVVGALVGFGLVFVLQTGLHLISGLRAPHREAAAAGLDGAGSLSIKALRVGDCLSEVPAGLLASPMPVVSCEQPHVAQVVAKFELPEVEYAGADRVRAAALHDCSRRVGGRLAERVGSGELGVIFTYPPAATDWVKGNRSVRCLITSKRGPITEVFPELPAPTS
jgi:hypothetical protein